MSDDDDELKSVVDLAVMQLTLVLGDGPARSLVAGCLARHGVATPSSLAELMALATCLMTHGGFAEVVGRSLRHHALRRGFSPADA